MRTVGKVAYDPDRVEISTIVSSDHFQHYIPIYCYTLRKAYPGTRISVAVTGKLDGITLRALEVMKGCCVRELSEPVPNWPNDDIVITTDILEKGVPMQESTVNTMRFLVFSGFPADVKIITDVDLMFFRGKGHLVDWHIQRMQELDTCYAAHHGPRKKPERFPGGWNGDKERIAGGFVMITDEWYRKTEKVREKYLEKLKAGDIGTYREEDEVVLCRIIKESGLPVPQDKNFPTELRGIHLGDFKFEHRWTNIEKMRTKLTDENCRKYQEMLWSDSTFMDIMRICCEDKEISEIFDRVGKHISERFNQ